MDADADRSLILGLADDHPDDSLACLAERFEQETGREVLPAAVRRVLRAAGRPVPPPTPRVPEEWLPEAARRRPGPRADGHRGRSGQTGYRGVYYQPQRPTPYLAVVWLPDGRRRYVGSFDSAEEAAEAYDRAAAEVLGPEAVRNFAETGEGGEA